MLVDSTFLDAQANILINHVCNKYPGEKTIDADWVKLRLKSCFKRNTQDFSSAKRT